MKRQRAGRIAAREKNQQNQSRDASISEDCAFPEPPPEGVLSRQAVAGKRSEEHTSELQSQSNLVCRLLLEKKTGSQDTYHVAGAIAYQGLVLLEQVCVH